MIGSFFVRTAACTVRASDAFLLSARTGLVSCLCQDRLLPPPRAADVPRGGDISISTAPTAPRPPRRSLVSLGAVQQVAAPITYEVRFWRHATIWRHAHERRAPQSCLPVLKNSSSVPQRAPEYPTQPPFNFQLKSRRNSRVFGCKKHSVQDAPPIMALNVNFGYNCARPHS